LEIGREGGREGESLSCSHQAPISKWKYMRERGGRERRTPSGLPVQGFECASRLERRRAQAIQAARAPGCMPSRARAARGLVALLAACTVNGRRAGSASPPRSVAQRRLGPQRSPQATQAPQALLASFAALVNGWAWVGGRAGGRAGGRRAGPFRYPVADSPAKPAGCAQGAVRPGKGTFTFMV
jgi:hypothetical protein